MFLNLIKIIYYVYIYISIFSYFKIASQAVLTILSMRFLCCLACCCLNTSFIHLRYYIFVYKQYLDGVFVIPGISKVEADYTCRDLDFSGYNKNRIQLLFYYNWE